MPQYKKVFDVGTYAGVSGYTRVGIPTLRTPGSGGKQVAKSLRFRSANSAYLNRTMAMQATRTLSMWIKRGAISVSGTDYNILFNDGSTGDFFLVIGQASSAYANKLRFTDSSGTPLYSAIVLSDPSTWYHIVVTQSSTATSIYINGTLSSSNSRAGVAISSSPMKISHTNTTQSFDGYMADVNFIDGQALTPSSFGEYNSDNIWVPKAYSGSYGTNGFYLDFNDTSSVAALGYDAAGSNDWTVNGISLTAGTTYDSMYDSPTDYDNSVYGAGNYAVLNPLDKDASTTLANGNLNLISSAAVGSATYRASRSTLAVSSGLWYAEFTLTQPSTSNAFSFGISPTTDSINGVNYYFGSSSGSYGFAYNGANQNKYNNGSGTQLAAGAPANGDYFQIAVDLTNGKIWFGKNNTWYEGNPSTGATPSFTFTPSGAYAIGGSVNATATATDQLDANFGQRTFSGTVPTGFKALNTKNITRPTDPNMWFYGDTPDLMWIKNRSATANHSLTDTVRGVGLSLASSSTSGDLGDQDVAEMNKFGMTLIGASSRTTAASNNFVYWAWKGGGTTPTTGTGTGGITNVQYSANVSSGFSIVTYTGSGAAGTVTHGLGVAPVMILNKARNAAYNWHVYFSTLGTGDFEGLNTTSAYSSASNWFNNAAVNSTTFPVGASQGTSNYVCYCFAPIAGYSSFGSYTGNGSTTGDGPFIYTGFRVKWLMVKRYDTGSTSNWQITHTGGSYYNGSGQGVYANLTQAEGTGVYHDLLSNGFKVKTNDGDANTLNGTYIYAAFAEVPFKIARAR